MSNEFPKKWRQEGPNRTPETQRRIMARSAFENAATIEIAAKQDDTKPSYIVVDNSRDVWPIHVSTYKGTAYTNVDFKKVAERNETALRTIVERRAAREAAADIPTDPNIPVPTKEQLADFENRLAQQRLRQTNPRINKNRR